MKLRRLIAAGILFGGSFSVAKLFSRGEQGVWYDPSDFSTMYQDSAGTTPVTAVEDPVGLILDKSKGLAAGGDVKAGTWNSSSGWSSSDYVVTATATQTGITLTPTSSISGKWVITTVAMTIVSGSVQIATGGNYWSGFKTVSGTYTSICLAANNTVIVDGGAIFTGSVEIISVKELPGNHASQGTAASRPTLSARVNLLLDSASMGTQNVTTTAIPYTLQHTGTGTITLSGTSTDGPLVGAGTLTFTPTAGTLTLTVTGTVTNAQLETGSTATRYQAITTATSYDTGGFPYYLKFDGVDDSLATASINFSAGDKMTVFAGVRKLSDAAVQILYELSSNVNSYNGTFASLPGYAGSASSVGAYWQSYSKGTVLDSAATTATYPAPATAVQTQTADIAGDSQKIRINGAVVVTSTDDQGTGNFGNYPLYIGMRAGTSLPFNGHLYSLIVRGAESTNKQITGAEKFVALKTGVSL